MTHRDAMEEGRRQAERVLGRRRARRASMRVARIRRLEAVREEPRISIAPELLAALGPASSRVLLAEGDSWFDYPWSDVLKELEDHHGFEIEAVSHRGDTIEQMAYGGGQLDDFVRVLEKLIRNGKTPEAILLSGGGNDVAGEEFALLLNHASSPTPGLNALVVAGIVADRVRHAYTTVVSAVTAVCESHLGAAIPILIHGYDYAVPDGRGFLGGWGAFPGPWLEPGFREKGYEDPATRLAIVEQLIDRFNAMLIELLAVQGLEHLRHIDLRGTLSRDATYKSWWANELHPTEQGFEAVAAKFVLQLPL